MAGLDLSLLRKGASELRDYQLAAASEALRGGTLLVMPTALGKTFVAAMVISHLLAKSPKKILFLTPTKPLAMQQAIRLMERNLVNPELIVSHRFPLTRIHEAVAVMGQPERNKVMINP